MARGKEKKDFTAESQRHRAGERRKEEERAAGLAHSKRTHQKAAVTEAKDSQNSLPRARFIPVCYRFLFDS